MFTIVNYRRRVAVLTALALVASVLVAVPAAAADDPEPSYTAIFSACGDAPASDFTDVPAGHSSAGAIDCIAYYAITQGTGDGNYSPRMAVTREHMALFLTRLASAVGIDLAGDPDDAGFTDIGELSAESQTAINQLFDLEITQGTSGTTYSPADNVDRDQMALFIARLMNLMDPMSDGDDDNGAEGYIPSDVKVTDDKAVGSPFTDIKGVTKEAYDAITNLYELGVATGISDTAYSPGSDITRAAMADFMAGVLDHSNARPAGVSITAAKTWDFGTYSTKLVVSYRDDMFTPMVDVSVKTFDSETVGSFTEDNTCQDPAECAWSDDDILTDDSGNIHDSGDVNDGAMNTYYAWMGDEDTSDFDADDADYASVTLSSTTDAVGIEVELDANEERSENKVNLDKDSSVVATVQLIDGDGDPVAKSGVEISCGSGADRTLVTAQTVYPPLPDALDYR